MNVLYRGCLNGDVVSEYLLAIELLRGKRVEKDSTQAYQYMYSAAIKGFLPAVDYLREHNPKEYERSQQYGIYAYGDPGGNAIENQLDL